MESRENIIHRASKRLCFRRDQKPDICTPRDGSSTTSIFSESLPSPAVRNTAISRPFSSAKASSTTADYDAVADQGGAKQTTTAPPNESPFPYMPRHAEDVADFAKQQSTFKDSLRDATSWESKRLVSALQESTSSSVRSGGQEADLVALTRNALEMVKRRTSGKIDKTPGSWTSSLAVASSALYHGRLMELLRQRRALPPECESHQVAPLRPQTEDDKPCESSHCGQQGTEEFDFACAKNETSQEGRWATSSYGISHHDTVPKTSHLEDRSVHASSGEPHSQVSNYKGDTLQFRAPLQNVDRRTRSPEGVSAPLQKTAGGKDDHGALTASPSASVAPQSRTDASLISLVPLLRSYSPATFPAGLHMETSTPQAPPVPSSEAVVQTLRALMSLTAPATGFSRNCRYPWSAGLNEKDFSTDSLEGITALLTVGNARSDTPPTSAARVCASSRAHPTLQPQRAQSLCGPLEAVLQPATQELLYSLLLSCGSGQNGQAATEREATGTVVDSMGTTGRDTRQGSAGSSPRTAVSSKAHTVAATTQHLSTPPRGLSSPSRTGLYDYASVSSIPISSPQYGPGSSVSEQHLGRQQYESQDGMQSVCRGRLGSGSSFLLAGKNHSVNVCHSSSEETAQKTPTHSTVRRRGSRLTAAEKETSPGNARGAAVDTPGVSRGRNRTDSLLRGDSGNKTVSQSRGEGTNKSESTGRGRGRYAGTAAGGGSLASGAAGRGAAVVATEADSSCGLQGNENGKPDVTLGGNRPHYHVAKQEWRVRYYLNGKRKMRTYSAKFYGYEAAHSMATDFAQYVDKNEALPHPVCKPVGVSGGRGAAALSTVMASRALTAATLAKEKEENPATPRAARYSTASHPILAELQAPPLRRQNSNSAAATKGFEAAGFSIEHACGQGVPSAASTVSAVPGAPDVYAEDGAESPAVTRSTGVSRSSTRLFQSSATPSDEETSPYYEHSLGTTVEPDTGSSSGHRHELLDESPLTQEYMMQDPQMPTHSSFVAVNHSPEAALAPFLESKKRRTRSVCAVGKTGTSTALEGPATTEEGTEEDTRIFCAPPAVSTMIKGNTESPAPGPLTQTSLGEEAARIGSVEAFFASLQDREKMYLSKLLSAVSVPSAGGLQSSRQVASMREGDAESSNLRRYPGGGVSTVSHPQARETAAVSDVAQVRRASVHLQQGRDLRSGVFQANSPSFFPFAAWGSNVVPFAEQRPTPYMTLPEPAAVLRSSASACSLATALLQRQAGRFPSRAAGKAGEKVAESTAVWGSENRNNSDDIRELSAGFTFKNIAGRGDVATTATTARTCHLSGRTAAGGRAEHAADVPSAIQIESDKIVGLAAGQATAAVLAKTAMSQQMLDTVMLFDEYIRGFEQVFSAEELRQQKKTSLAPTPRFAPNLSTSSAGVPSLSSAVPGSRGDRNMDSYNVDSLPSPLPIPLENKNTEMTFSRTLSNHPFSENKMESAYTERATSSLFGSAHTPKGVHSAVTGIQLQLGSSELLVLSRLLVELTSSTYTLVTTLKTTLASSFEVVQKHSDEPFPRPTAATRKLPVTSLPEGLRLQREAGKTEESGAESHSREERSNVIQRAGKPSGRVPLAEHEKGDTRRQQLDVKDRQYERESLAKNQMHAGGVANAYFPCAAGGGQENTANAECIQQGGSSSEAAGRAAPLDSRVSFGKRPLTAANKMVSLRETYGGDTETAAAQSATVSEAIEEGEGEKTEEDIKAVVQSTKELPPKNGISDGFGVAAVAHQTLQAAISASRKGCETKSDLPDCTEPGSSCEPAGESCDESEAPAEADRTELTVCGSSGCTEEKSHRWESMHITTSAAATEQNPQRSPTCLSSSVQHRVAEGLQEFPGGREREEQQKEAPLEAKASAADTAQPEKKPSCDQGAGEAKGEKIITAQQHGLHGQPQPTMAETQLLEKPLQQRDEQCFSNVMERCEGRTQQQNGRAADTQGAGKMPAAAVANEVTTCACTDSRAVLQSVVDLLQSQQRLVALVTQMQVSLPQYLRLIIRVVGHCFLPYKLPPATHFIEQRTTTVVLTEAGATSSSSAAGNAAAPAAPSFHKTAGEPPSSAAIETERQQQFSRQLSLKSLSSCSPDQVEAAASKRSCGLMMTSGEAGGRSSSSLEFEKEDKTEIATKGGLLPRESGKPYLGLSEELSTFSSFSRQNSCSMGFTGCGAVTSASSTDVEYSCCAESPGLPGKGAVSERKLSTKAVADEESSSRWCEVVVGGEASPSEASGRNKSGLSNDSVVSSKTQAAAGLYISTEEKNVWDSSKDNTDSAAATAERKAGGGCESVNRGEKGGDAALGIGTSFPAGQATPFVEVVGGGRVIKDEAALELFLFRPFQSAACSCQERPCPCDRQHIADLIHLLYVLPRSRENTNDAHPLPPSMSLDVGLSLLNAVCAAAGGRARMGAFAPGEAAAASVSPATGPASRLAASQQSVTGHTSGTANDAAVAAATTWLRQLPQDHLSNLNESFSQRDQTGSIPTSLGEEGFSEQELQFTASNSSSKAGFKSHSRIASSRTTSSGSSSSSSDPSVAGAEALTLVAESVKQLLFAEKLAESKNGVLSSSTRAVSSASASPFCGSQTTGTPHNLLSDSDTPGSASSCASSPLQRGIIAAAVAASSLLQEAARQSPVPASVEERKGVTREVRTATGAATTTVNGEHAVASSSRKRGRNIESSASSFCPMEEPGQGAALPSSAVSAKIQKAAGHQTAAAKEGESVAFSFAAHRWTAPVQSGALGKSLEGGSATLPATISSLLGAERPLEKLENGVTAENDSSYITSRDAVEKGRAEEHRQEGSAAESAKKKTRSHAERAAARGEERDELQGEERKLLAFPKEVPHAGNPRVEGRGMDRHMTERNTREEIEASSCSTAAKRCNIGASAVSVETKSSGLNRASATPLDIVGGSEEDRIPATRAAEAPQASFESVAAALPAKCTEGAEHPIKAATVEEVQTTLCTNGVPIVAGDVAEDERWPVEGGSRRGQFRGSSLAIDAAISSTKCEGDALRGGVESSQLSEQMEKDSISTSKGLKRVGSDVKDNEKQKDSKCEGEDGAIKDAEGGVEAAAHLDRESSFVDISSERRASANRKGSEEAGQKGAETRTVRCPLLQERQCLLLQERSAALLKLSYPAMLASILPLQSLAHTIAGLILHLHRQLIHRFVAAHAPLLLGTQGLQFKTVLTPGSLQHLVRQLTSSGVLRRPKLNILHSRGSNADSTIKSSTSRSGSSFDSGCSQDSQGIYSPCCLGQGIRAPAATVNCGGAMRNDEFSKRRFEHIVAAAAAFADGAAGQGEGTDLGEMHNEGYKRRIVAAMRLKPSTTALPLAATKKQKVLDHGNAGYSNSFDVSSSYAGGGSGGIGGVAAARDCVATPASYASLFQSGTDQARVSRFSGGLPQFFQNNRDEIFSCAARTNKGHFSKHVKNEGEELGSCLTVSYSDVVRAAPAALRASEASPGLQVLLPLSRERGPASTAAAMQRSTLSGDSCVTFTAGNAGSNTTCASPAARKQGGTCLVPIDLTQEVLSRPSPTAGSIVRHSPVEDTVERWYQSNAAELSRYLVRAQALCASRITSEKQTEVPPPRAEERHTDPVPDSLGEDERSSLLAFLSAREGTSRDTRSCIC